MSNQLDRLTEDRRVLADALRMVIDSLQWGDDSNAIMGIARAALEKVSK